VLSRRVPNSAVDPDQSSGLPGFMLPVAALVLAAAGLILPSGPGSPLLFGASAGLIVMALWTSVHKPIRDRIDRSLPRDLQDRLTATQTIAVVTAEDGRVIAANGKGEKFGFRDRGAPMSKALGQLSIDPDGTIARVMVRLTDDDIADARLGLLPDSDRLQATRYGKRHIFWTVLPGDKLSDLAVMTVSAQSVRLNEIAKTMLGGVPIGLADSLAGRELRNGGMVSLPRVDTTPLSARLFQLRSTGLSVEYAIIPDPANLPDTTVVQTPVSATDDLLRLLPVPMLKIGADGMLLEANVEARSILALDDRKLPPLFELVEGMGRSIAEWISEAASGRGLLKPEIVRAVIPGQELYLQITLGRMLEKGEVVLVGILNDATELKTLEAQFVQSQKMQAIGQLAGGVAHDFNNLLTAISGHCDLLLLRHDARDPDYADLIQISQNANRAASLVGQLLAFSRKQNLKPQSLDLRDTMVDLAHLLNRLIGERVQLDVTHAPGPQLIRADRRQLEQVIVNLVVNARDAMPDGGKITVQTRSEFLSEELTRDRARLLPGDYVVIEVADTGVGIPEEVVSKIFEPFFTTKKTGEGTGLGLSTAYGIVKQTGGFIFVDSRPNEGTTFSLYFPAASPDDPKAEAPKRSRALTAPRKLEASILLVEDEAPVRAFACRALSLRGYNVIEAENAEEALEILSDKQLTVDLFVTDVIMPGMDGPTWVRRALKDRPDTGVVFMSGYAEEGRAEKQSRIPNSDFLPKPFSLNQLTNLVHEKLH